MGSRDDIPYPSLPSPYNRPCLVEFQREIICGEQITRIELRSRPFIAIIVPVAYQNLHAGHQCRGLFVGGRAGESK